MIKHAFKVLVRWVNPAHCRLHQLFPARFFVRAVWFEQPIQKIVHVSGLQMLGRPGFPFGWVAETDGRYVDCFSQNSQS